MGLGSIVVRAMALEGVRVLRIGEGGEFGGEFAFVLLNEEYIYS